MINADFLLTTDREKIQEDEKWNHWLRGCIADVYKEAFLSFLTSDKLDLEKKYSAYASVPLNSREDFLEPVVKEIHANLKNSACILTTPDFILEKPENTRKADQKFYELFINDTDTEPPGYLINKVKLVCPQINKNKYEQQLKAIGVERIEPIDLFECLKETEWLHKHSLEWFIYLYKFLSSKKQWYSTLFNKKDNDNGFNVSDNSRSLDYSLNKLSIVPTETDNIDSFGLKGTYDQPIYFSCDDESAEKLKSADKWLSEIMHVIFLNQNFLELVEKQEDSDSIKEFMQEQLDIHDFDLNNCCNNILKKLKQSDETLEPDALIKITEFLADNADDNFPWQELPVIVADGRKMLIKGIRKLTWDNGSEKEMHPTIQAVVVPEAFDPESGWQYIWQEEEDRQHFIALADDYKDFPEEWFDACNIKKYPGFARITFTSKNSFESMSKKGFTVSSNERKCFDLCMSRSAFKWISKVKVTSFGMPSALILNLGEEDNQPLSANALMAFLKTLSFKNNIYSTDEQFYENGLKAKGTFQCHGKRINYYDNTILYYLKELKWMPSKQGFVSPTNAFLPTEEIKNIFGDNVSYVAPGIHQDILEILGVCLKPTVKKTLEILKKYSSENLPVNSETISHIYYYLKNVTRIENHGGYNDNDTVRNKNDVRKAFQEYPLIFIPEEDIEFGTWHEIDDCVWKDSSDVFDSDFVYLEKYYPEFKNFFVNTIAMNEDVNTNNIPAFLQRLSKNNQVDIEKIKKIYSKIDSLLDASNTSEKFVIKNQFSTHPLIFIPDDTESGIWYKRDDCVWLDSRDILGNEFVYLEKYYSELKDFFVKTLDIKEEADEELFAKSWLKLQDSPVKDKEKLHVTITKLYKKLRKIAESETEEEDRPDWWNEFSEKIKFYTQSHTFEKPGKILIPDDGGLKTIFKNSNIYFVWRPKGDSFNEWLSFYKAFNIPLLSESAIPDYEENVQSTYTNSQNKYITKSSVLMIATWLKEKRKNDYDRLLEDGKFDNLISIQEATTASNIMVLYHLDIHDIHESQEAEFPVYWDTKKNILIYNPKNSKKKMRIEISKIMAKRLLNYKDYKDCADFVELTLKEDDTERLKSKGWSVPREIENKYLDKKKANDKLHNLEQNQFDVPDESNTNIIDNKNHQEDEQQENKPINIEQPSNSRPELPKINPAVQKNKNGSSLTPKTIVETKVVDDPLTQNKSPEILATGNIESKKIDKIDGSAPDASDSTHSTDNFESQKRNKIDSPMFDNSVLKPLTVEPTDKLTDRPEFKIDVKTLLNDPFNRPGVTSFDEDENYYSNNRVKNPERRAAKRRAEYRRTFQNEPKPEQRRHKVEIELLEGPDPKVRETLSQWYDGKCQICGNTWPKRNGEPYFTAAYLMERQNAKLMDTPANAVCLCAEHFAQWCHAAIEAPLDIMEQIKELRLPFEDGKDELSIVFTLQGKDCEIKYCKKHFLDLKELIKALAEISCSENLN
ncbi:MAG: hypothetical protein U9P79_01855 [Candidatus Cloacimonadota bacterium]|nr:hypothetical protein [Candidatus Cloacimonadota bacterium]